MPNVFTVRAEDARVGHNGCILTPAGSPMSVTWAAGKTRSPRCLHLWKHCCTFAYFCLIVEDATGAIASHMRKCGKLNVWGVRYMRWPRYRAVFGQSACAANWKRRN